MCGIFGFATKDGTGPDLDRLRKVAVVTQTRGAHAFGLAWIDQAGRIGSYKTPGPAEDHLDAIDQCRDAVMVIGHCRYATHGLPSDNRNNHPHAAGGGWFVHNGIVGNDNQLIREHGLRPQTECDSEVLGLLMARCPGTIAQRAAWSARQTYGELAVLGLWRNPSRLLVVRRGRPLAFGQCRAAYYFASLPTGLPGLPQDVADRAAYVVTYQDGQLRMDGHPVGIDGDWDAE